MTGSTKYRAASVVTAAVPGLPGAAPRHADLDPGTGRIIQQGLLAAGAVAIGVLRLYWQRFQPFLSDLTARSQDYNNNDGDLEFEQDSDIQTRSWTTHGASETNTVDTPTRMRLPGRTR